MNFKEITCLVMLMAVIGSLVWFAPFGPISYALGGVACLVAFLVPEKRKK